MKPIIIFLIWLFLSPTLALSQNDSVPYNQIKLSAEQLLNPINWGAKLSYEKSYLRNRLSTEIGGTVLIPYSEEYSQKGFRAHVSQKFFYHRKSTHQYFGVGYQYQNSSFTDVGFFTDSTLSNYPYGGVEDEYRGTKELHMFNLIWGFQIIKNHFVFEFGGGIGIKYRNVKHFDRANPGYDMVRPRHPNVHYSAMVESEGFHISFPVTVKIGYVF